MRNRPWYAGTGHNVAFAAACVAFSCAIEFGTGNAWAQESPPDASAPAEAAKRAPVGNEREAAWEASGPDERDAAPEPHAPAEEGLASTEEAKPGTVDVVHGFLSREVLATAEWLDSFFDDPRFAAEENRTVVKLGMDYVLERDTKPDFSVPASARIRLPKLEEKARIVLTGSEERDLEGQALATGTAASRLPGAQDNDVSAAVDYFFRATKRVNVALRVGARAREGEPELFVQPRYRKLWNFDPLAFRFTQDFKWWTEFGWEATTTLDLERPLSDTLFFRTTLQGAWAEEESDNYYYSLSFSLRHILSPRRVVQYELVNGFQTRNPNDLDEVRATVRYRQRVWRDWLFYEIAPYASFRRERDFDFTPGILLWLEAFFGRWEGVGI